MTKAQRLTLKRGTEMRVIVAVSSPRLRIGDKINATDDGKPWKVCRAEDTEILLQIPVLRQVPKPKKERG
jgi:hypothetical protein